MDDYISVNVGDCGSGCTGNESLNVKCTRSGKIKATATKGEPGRPVSFFLEGVDEQKKNFNDKGKAKANWGGNPPGEFEVSAKLACEETLVEKVVCN